MSRSSGRRWSQYVTETSHALDLEQNVFTLRSPRAIALSLRRSAVKSTRRHSTPFQSAMSMLTFYANRAGRNLRADRRLILEQAKLELRKIVGRELASHMERSRGIAHKVSAQDSQDSRAGKKNILRVSHASSQSHLP